MVTCQMNREKMWDLIDVTVNVLCMYCGPYTRIYVLCIAQLKICIFICTYWHQLLQIMIKSHKSLIPLSINHDCANKILSDSAIFFPYGRSGLTPLQHFDTVQFTSLVPWPRSKIIQRWPGVLRPQLYSMQDRDLRPHALYQKWL